jgi:hypothetical protein
MKLEFYIKHYGKSFYWAGKFLKKMYLLIAQFFMHFAELQIILLMKIKTQKIKLINL